MLCVSSTFLCLHRTCGCLQWLESKPQTALLHASQLSLVDNKQMSKWRCKCATALFFPLRDFPLCQNRQIKDGCCMLSKFVGCLFLASEFIYSLGEPYSCSAQRCTRSWHWNCWAQQDMAELQLCRFGWISSRSTQGHPPGKGNCCNKIQFPISY